MTTIEVADRLTEASHRALGDDDPYATFLAWGLTLEDAAGWCAAWVEELAGKAKELGEDPTGREFLYRVAVGQLAVGIELGRNLAANNRPRADSTEGSWP